MNCNRACIKLYAAIFLFGLALLSACGSPPPPPAPTGLSTDANKNIDGVIVITWIGITDDKNIAGYRVYRDTDLNGTFKEMVFDTKSPTVTEYKDENVLVGDTYETKFHYKVTTYFIDGYTTPEKTESVKSNAITANSANFNPPGAPVGLKVQASNIDGNKKFVISWTANREVDLKGYFVYRSEEDKPISPAVATPISELVKADKTQSKVEYIDNKNLEPGKRYYYTVAAVDRGDLKSQNPPALRENDILIDIVTLEAPTNASTADASPTFKWTAVDGAAGYVVTIQKQKFGGEVVWRSAFVDKNEVAFSGTALTSGQTYYWYVYAFSKKPANNEEDGSSNSDLWSFTVQ